MIVKHSDIIEFGSELLVVNFYLRVEKDLFEEAEPDYSTYNALVCIDVFCPEKDAMATANVSVMLPLDEEEEIDYEAIVEEFGLLDQAVEKLFIDIAKKEVIEELEEMVVA